MSASTQDLSGFISNIFNFFIFRVVIDGISSAVPPGIFRGLFVDGFCVAVAGSSAQGVQRRLQMAINRD